MEKVATKSNGTYITTDDDRSYIMEDSEEYLPLVLRTELGSAKDAVGKKVRAHRISEALNFGMIISGFGTLASVFVFIGADNGGWPIVAGFASAMTLLLIASFTYDHIVRRGPGKGYLVARPLADEVSAKIDLSTVELLSDERTDAAAKHNREAIISAVG